VRELYITGTADSAASIEPMKLDGVQLEMGTASFQRYASSSFEL